MSQLPKAPAAVRVDTDPDTVVAGQPVAVTVRIVSDRPLQVLGGAVALVRSSAVTRFRRQWMGAGSRSGHRLAGGLDLAADPPRDPVEPGAEQRTSPSVPSDRP